MSTHVFPEKAVQHAAARLYYTGGFWVMTKSYKERQELVRAVIRGLNEATAEAGVSDSAYSLGRH